MLKAGSGLDQHGFQRTVYFWAAWTPFCLESLFFLNGPPYLVWHGNSNRFIALPRLLTESNPMSALGSGQLSLGADSLWVTTPLKHTSHLAASFFWTSIAAHTNIRSWASWVHSYYTPETFQHWGKGIRLGYILYKCDRSPGCVTIETLRSRCTLRLGHWCIVGHSHAVVPCWQRHSAFNVCFESVQWGIQGPTLPLFITGTNVVFVFVCNLHVTVNLAPNKMHVFFIITVLFSILSSEFCLYGFWLEHLYEDARLFEGYYLARAHRARHQCS